MVLCMVFSLPACPPHAMFALVTTGMIAASVPAPSPRSLLKSIERPTASRDYAPIPHARYHPIGRRVGLNVCSPQPRVARRGGGLSRCAGAPGTRSRDMSAASGAVSGEGARARALPEPLRGQGPLPLGQDPRLVGWVTRWGIAALGEEGG